MVRLQANKVILALLTGELRTAELQVIGLLSWFAVTNAKFFFIFIYHSEKKHYSASETLLSLEQ